MTMECPLSPMAAVLPPAPPMVIPGGTSRVVSPFLEQLQETTTTSEEHANPMKTIRLVVDRASPHATTSVSSKAQDPPIKARRRRKHVRFHPTIQYHSRSSTSSVDSDDNNGSSSWLDVKSLIVLQHQSRKRAHYFATRTNVAETIAECLSSASSEYDPTSPTSLRIQEQLVQHCASRGLEARILPHSKDTRSAATRQVVLMARKLAADNFLDPDTQALWVADKARQLSAGCLRLARHLAEADATVVAKLSSSSTIEEQQQKGN